MIKENIESGLREMLEQSPLYDQNHWVGVHSDDKNIYINYGPTSSRLSNMGKTAFDLQITGDVCFILFMNIEKEKRRQGYGTQLHDIIERFCGSEFGCKRFRTTPSGQGKYFLEKIGFEYINANEAEKVVE